MITPHAPRVGVVLVNWRGWRDTLLSLETLFAGDYQAFDAVVVDNASGDDSVEHIHAWADGQECVVIPPELSGRVAGRSTGSVVDSTILDEANLATPFGTRVRLTIVRAARNGGFAAGNNLALDYLRRLGGYDYFWLLNNDAFPAPAALTLLVARAEADPSLGQIGATLIYAGRPDIVQALGGAVFEPRSGRAYHIGAETPLAAAAEIPLSDIEPRMSYVIGASILISAQFLQKVGLMEESYFLYFEELDWAERGKAEFGMGYARDALVYHKAGGSTQKKSRRSSLAAYYLARNRIRVTKRFYPECLRSVLVEMTIETLRYVARRRWSEANGFFRALREWVGFAFKVGRR
jgi:GT2 family glycosyltransferase